MLLVLSILTLSDKAAAQQTLPPDLKELIGKTVYQARLSHFDEFPVRRGDVVFLGDNLIQYGEWDEIFIGVPVRNRGIVGDRADALYLRLPHIRSAQPAAIVMHIGTNDLKAGASVEEAMARVNLILAELNDMVPADRILVLGAPPTTANQAQNIRAFNYRLEQVVRTHQNVYVDIFPALVGRQDAIYGAFSIRGWALSGRGYRVVAEMLLPYLIKIAGEQRNSQDQQKGRVYDLRNPSQTLPSGVAAGSPN